MAIPPRPLPGDSPSEIAIEAAGQSGSGRLATVVSAVALLFSGFSLWGSSLKAPDIQAFVPPVIQYASPYNNTNFEVFAIPVTFINDGGRSGTVLALDLGVTNTKTKETKHFMASDFGRWTMEKTCANTYEPFEPPGAVPGCVLCANAAPVTMTATASGTPRPFVSVSTIFMRKSPLLMNSQCGQFLLG